MIPFFAYLEFEMRGQDALARAGGDARRYEYELIRVADADVIDLHRLIGTVVRVAAHPCDLLHQGHAGGIALTEDSVATVQAWVRNLGNKKLRAIGAGAGICVGQAPRTIEFQVGRS